SAGRMHPGFSTSLHQGAWALLATLGVTAGAGLLLSRRPMSVAVRFALLNFGMLAIMVTTADFQKFEMLPQVGRLHLEMEMGACLLLGTAAWALLGVAPRSLRPALIVLCLALLVVQFGNDRRQARALIQYARLAAHSEYTTARWIDTHMGGSRV